MHARAHVCVCVRERERERVCGYAGVLIKWVKWICVWFKLCHDRKVWKVTDVCWVCVRCIDMHVSYLMCRHEDGITQNTDRAAKAFSE